MPRSTQVPSCRWTSRQTAARWLWGRQTGCCACASTALPRLRPLVQVGRLPASSAMANLWRCMRGLFTEQAVKSADLTCARGSTLLQGRCSCQCRWALASFLGLGLPLSHLAAIHTGYVCRRALHVWTVHPALPSAHVAASSPATYAFKQALFISGLFTPPSPCSVHSVCAGGALSKTLDLSPPASCSAQIL